MTIPSTGLTSGIDDALARAEDALDGGDPEETLAVCTAILALDESNARAHVLIGDAYREMEADADAEHHYRLALVRDGSQVGAFVGLAQVLFDHLHFDDAREFVSRGIRMDDEEPDLYWIRALLRERRADWRGAQRDYRRAAELDPTRYRMPVPLDDETVEAAVVEALTMLPDVIRSAMHQVAVVLEELPEAEVCAEYDPPAPSTEILGLFSGVPMNHRSIDDPWTLMPATISIYRRNLARVAATHDELLEQLAITLFHEIGHFVGLDEDDLEERGLD